MLDPRTELANTHVHSFNPTGHVNESRGAMNFGTRARKTAQNYENYRNWDGGGVQFRAEKMEDESGVASPPLWKASPPGSPTHTRHLRNNYRNLSPNSRAQAIARGQWELMEMVKNMPESSYELTLKDLVEHPSLEAQEEYRSVEETSLDVQPLNKRVKVVKRQESKKNIDKKASMTRSRSIENGGLLLKMVFPFSLGSKKKKVSATNAYSRVSPKPAEALDKSSKGVVDKEWWKKRSSVSSESESGTTAISSGNSGSRGSSSTSSRSNSSSRKSRGCSTGCWSFLSKKNKNTAK